MFCLRRGHLLVLRCPDAKTNGNPPKKEKKTLVLNSVPHEKKWCFRKWWYPQIIQFHKVFNYKPSILGYPYFWKHPNIPCQPSGPVQPHYLQRLVLGVLSRNLALEPQEGKEGLVVWRSQTPARHIPTRLFRRVSRDSQGW